MAMSTDTILEGLNPEQREAVRYKGYEHINVVGDDEE